MGSILQICNILLESRGYGKASADRDRGWTLSRDNAWERPAGRFPRGGGPSKVPRAAGKAKAEDRLLLICLLPDDEPCSFADRAAGRDDRADNAASFDRLQPILQPKIQLQGPAIVGRTDHSSAEVSLAGQYPRVGKPDQAVRDPGQ